MRELLRLDFKHVDTPKELLNRISNLRPQWSLAHLLDPQSTHKMQSILEKGGIFTMSVNMPQRNHVLRQMVAALFG